MATSEAEGHTERLVERSMNPSTKHSVQQSEVRSTEHLVEQSIASPVEHPVERTAEGFASPSSPTYCGDPSEHAPDVTRYALFVNGLTGSRLDIYPAPIIPPGHLNRRRYPPLYQQVRAAACCNSDVRLALAETNLVVISKRMPSRGHVVQQYP